MTPPADRAFTVVVVDREGTAGAAIGQHLLMRHLRKRGVGPDVIDVTAAGWDAVAGAPMDGIAVAALAPYGIDTDGFAARELGPLVNEADMILVGSRPAFDEVVSRHPFARPRLFTLSEVAQADEFPAAIAPLAEHPQHLHEARQARELGTSYDVEPPTDAAGFAALVDKLDGDAAWIAGVWAAIVPGVGGDARQLPATVGPIVDLPLEAFGVRVLVRCTGAGRDELAAAATRIWARCLRDDGVTADVEIEAMLDPQPNTLAEARSRGAVAHTDVELVLHYLSSAVTVRAIDARAGDLMMFHAAGLASEDGNVVGLVAASGTGKTTIARTLGRHFGYVTDETLAVTHDGVVLPYPKPLSLVRDTGESHKEQRGPDSLGLLRPSEPLRLGRIVLLDRADDGPVSPVLEPIDLLDGLAMLAPQVSYLGRVPRMLHGLADAVESRGGLVVLRYRDAVSTLPVIEALLGERS